MKLNRLDELRHILLRPGLERLEELTERVETTDRRAADVAEVLPDSIAASFRKDSRLIGALRTPLRQCVAESVRENPDEYADALFPVMGPAIRRSITEALRGWTRQINQVIEQSLSPRGMGWRFQAWRAGVPYGEYVLQRTLLYRVEDVYLIHSASGLLIAHVTQRDAPIQDEDAVSAMFIAIQEFVRDSFTRERGQRLTTAELGELSLWAVHGPSSTIVAVIRGAPPVELRGQLESTLERIETARGESLRDYAGDRESMTDIGPDLEGCLLVSLRESSARSASWPALAAVALVVLGVVGWLAYGVWMQDKVARVADAFALTPGILVTELERDGGAIIVRGLRDRLAPSPTAIAAAAGWQGGVTADFRPFLSLDDEIVLERARAALAPPATVSMRINEGALSLEGRAPSAWIETVEGAAARVPGVERIELVSLAASDAESGLLTILRERLAPPESVDLTLEGRVLRVSGEAPKQWADMAQRIDLPVGVDSIAMASLTLSEQRAMEAVASEVSQLVIEFDRGQTAIPPREQTKVVRLAESLIDHQGYARALGMSSRVLITGHSDASGSRALNVALERARAETLAASLREAGIASGALVTTSQLETQVTGRRAAIATVRVQAQPSTISAQD
jgi:OOP family OmpA-OmpF porin